jgi:hypothetical protein
MVATRLIHFTCLAALAFLAACGDGGTPATGEPAAHAHGKAPSPIAFSGRLEFPRDVYVSPELIQQRRGSEVTTFTLAGDEAWKKNPDSSVDPDLKVLNMVTSNNMAWGVYQIPDLLSADNPTLATVDFSAGNIPDIAWIGVADYSQQRWVFTEVTTPTISNNFSLDPNLNVVSLGGNAYVAIVIAGEDTAQLSQVQLRLDLHAVPPTNLSASTDDSMYIWISWEPVLDEGVEGYLVERAFSLEDPWTTIETYPFPEQPFHLDIHGGENQLPEGTNVYYRVRSYIGSAVGPPSLVAAGMRPHRLPSPDIQATPESGYSPLTVELDASRSVDPGGGEITKFEWDWTNDGTYDLDSGIDPVVTPPAYTVTGVNETTLRVTDDEGMTNSVTVEITVTVDPPLAELSSDLTFGPSPLVVSFDASASTDPDGGGIANYQWDWEGDGTFDFDSGPDGAIQHQFEDLREYNTTVLVTDDDGQTDTAMVKITAKDPYGSWYHTFGKGSSEKFTASTEDSDGNIIAVGNQSGGSWVAKLTAEGELLWLKLASSLNLSFVTTDSQNNIFAAGDGIALMKVDPNGTVLWTRSYSADTDINRLHNLTVAGSSIFLFIEHQDVSTATYAYGVVEYNASGTVSSRRYWEDFRPMAMQPLADDSLVYCGVVQTGPVLYDSVLTKFDETEALEWGRSLAHGPGGGGFTRVELCSDGQLCVSGYDSGGPTIATEIQKWDIDGELLWARSISSPDDYTLSMCVKVLPGGEIATSAFLQRSNADYDGVLSLWDASGNNLMAKLWSNPGEVRDSFLNLSIASNGDLLIAGMAKHVLAGNPAQPTWTWDDFSDALVEEPEPTPVDFTPTPLDFTAPSTVLSRSLTSISNPQVDFGDILGESDEALLIRLNLASIE